MKRNFEYKIIRKDNVSIKSYKRYQNISINIINK